MRWQQGRRSENLEDRRSAGGMPGGAPAIGGLGLLIVIVLGLVFGINPLSLLELVTGGGGPVVVQTGPSAEMSPEEAATAAARPTSEVDDFISVVLASTEDAWGKQFAESNLTYHNPRLVLYSDVVQSACGTNSASSGPFYCPSDQRLYLDTSFLQQLRQLGASGDFAFAYVIAHEVGHHVQHELNIDAKVRSMRSNRARQRPTSSRSCSSCRPTAWPACGRITPTKSKAGWSRATSRRACRRPPRSATTG